MGLYPPEQGLCISRKTPNPALTLFYQNAGSPALQTALFYCCHGPGWTELGKNVVPLRG